MDTPPPLKEERIPLRSCIWVSVADSACAILSSLAISGVLTYYFTRWRGLDPQLASIVWLLFGVWNAINDPLFGHISDRTRTRLGRRIPYIRYGAPLYALAFIACWIDWPGSHTDQLAMFVQLLVLLFIVDTLYTAIATAIYIMPYEMAVSNKARSGVYIWKIIFMVFPLAIPLALIPIIQPGPGQDATGYQWTMVGFGVVMGALIFVSTFFYKELHFQQEEKPLPFLQSLKECFRNRSFILFEAISFTVIYVQTALMQGVLYYFDEIKLPALSVGVELPAMILLFASLAVGIVAGLVVWVRQRDAWGVKRSVQIMCLLFGVGCAMLLLLGRELLPAMLGFFLAGTGFSGGMYLVPLMFGDVMDKDEERTGLRREGMYAGVNSFITKPAISIAQAVFLTALTFFGYDQALGKGLQSYSAQTGILVGWVAAPAILLLTCFGLLHWYPLAGPAWEEVKRRLAAAHREKEKQYVEKMGFKYVE